MLTITQNNRSYTELTTDSGISFFHYKTLRAFDKLLKNYNEEYDPTCSPFCKGPYTFVQDDDISLFIYYKDGKTYTGEETVKSIRINQIENGIVSTECGDEFYGGLWKITYDSEMDIYYIREISENYDNEVDAYVNGEILPH